MNRNLGKRRIQHLCKKFSIKFYTAPLHTDFFNEYFLYLETSNYKKIDIRFYSTRKITIYFYNREHIIHYAVYNKYLKFYEMCQHINEYLNERTKV